MTDSSPRVALITGAGQGIGRGIAIRLATDGFDIAVNDIDRSRDNAESVAAEVRSLGRRAVVAAGDVTDPESVAQMVATTVEELGTLSVTVANAGIARPDSLLEATAEQWDQVFAVNTKGVFLTWQAAARQYIAQGGGGKLIAAASQAAYRGSPDLPAYSVSKAAVRSLTQVAAQAFAQYGITANSYAPGIVQTPLWTGAEDAFNALVAGIPLGRAQQPEDVAALVSYFASPDADYMTGQTVIMDGGMIFP